jgi:DNA-directed RNA polymerase sigma subunit (sigma70/sigma32)
MLTIKPDIKRMKEIAKAYNEGATMAQIGRDFKLTRQRVLQVLRSQCKRYQIGVISHVEWMEKLHKLWFDQPK